MTSTLYSVGGVPGLLRAEEIAQTGAQLASLQIASGQIPWFPGGHSDPWNHVEAAMALTVTGHVEEARAAYRWLAESQLGDGSWFNYYVGVGVKDTRLDTNVCAYV
ncbi:MAG: prenyltransferase, partial [Acidimicrobiales bacterium]